MQKKEKIQVAADKKSGQQFFKDELKNGLGKAYFFYGAEDYMKEYCLHEAEKAICGSRDSLDLTRLTGDDFSLAALEDALSAAGIGFDLFSLSEDENETHGRLTELYELDYKTIKPSEFSALCKLINERASTDSRVIIYATEAELPSDSQKHRSIISELSKVAVPVVFSPEPPAKLASWIIGLSKREGVTFEPREAYLLLERAGKNMSVLKNEVSKVCAYVRAKGKSAVLAEDIAEVCVKNRESSPFEFANALTERDGARALAEFAFMRERGDEPAVILSKFTSALSDMLRVRGCMDAGMTRFEAAKALKLHEYKVKLMYESLKNERTDRLFEAAESAMRADVALKTSACDGFILIERLICELTGRQNDA